MRVLFRLDAELTPVVPILLQISNVIPIIQGFPFFSANNNKIKQETVFNNLTYNNAISYSRKFVAD